MSITQSSPYDVAWYDYHRDVALKSARGLVPHVISLVQPQSVVDLGCGTGEWLSVFQEHGITDVLGIDGEWVPRDQLQIPQDRFIPHDLCSPLRLERTFDCAVSLETGEHLPADCAATFVASLVGLAPVVLFSAALPGQGGLDHLNEQWPSYWSDLFSEHGFVTIDCIRPLICRSPDVAYWYVWNVLLFAERSCVERNETLKALYEAHGGPPLPWVNADFWSSGPDSWSGELRRMRNTWRVCSEVVSQGVSEYLAASLNIERLVEELRAERDAWKDQAKRHEEVARDLRSLLRNQSNKKGKLRKGTG